MTGELETTKEKKVKGSQEIQWALYHLVRDWLLPFTESQSDYSRYPASCSFNQRPSDTDTEDSLILPTQTSELRTTEEDQQPIPGLQFLQKIHEKGHTRTVSSQGSLGETHTNV